MALYIITGACGAGKSTIMPLLKKKLKRAEVHDFDSVGVPANPTISWRLQTTDYWLKKAMIAEKNGKPMIILGLVIPQEVKQSKYLTELKDVHFCLLDLNQAERKRRLRQRGASDCLMADTEELTGLRKWIKHSGLHYKIINVSRLSPKNVSERILKWIYEENNS